MTDLRLDMPFTTSEIDAYLQELNDIRREIARVDREPPSPAALSHKIILLTDAQHVIGELYAQMVYDHSVAYVERKNAHAAYRDAFQAETEKAKDAYAEEMTKAERMKEAKAKAQMKRWEMQYNNAEQRANAIKKMLEVMSDDMYGRGGRSGGR